MHILSLSSALAAGWAAVATAPAAAAAPTVPAAGELGPVPRIIGGFQAPSDQFGYVAYLRALSEDYDGGVCTGTLIAPSVVLTAAHCTQVNKFISYRPYEYKIMFGANVPRFDVDFEGYSVESYVVHPEYNSWPFGNDIALFFLNETVPDSVAKPIKIYSGDTYTTTPMAAAGFGLTDIHNNQSLATQLMEVNLFPGTPDYCRKQDGNFHQATQICTDGTGGIDTCEGDSGGPIVTPLDNGDGYAQLAVTSYGVVNDANPDGECGKAGGSGVYTRISPYLGWIAKTANLTASDISATNVTVSKTPGIRTSTAASICASGSSQALLLISIGTLLSLLV